MKKEKSGSNVKKYLKVVFLLIIILLFSNWIYIIYTNIKTIGTTDVVESFENIYQLEETDTVRKTLVVYEDAYAEEEENIFILAIIYNTDTSNLLIYNFPANLYIQEDVGNKHVSIRNLTYAGHSYVHNGKYSYVLRQISAQMGMDFDSYVWIRSEMSKNFFMDTEPLQIFSRLSMYRLIMGYKNVNIISEFLNSNMSFTETYNYFQQINFLISRGNYEYINLGDDDMNNDFVLGTGKKVDVLDISALDRTIRRNYTTLMNKDLAREHVKVEVYNGSNIPMYARKVGRRIHNSGCNVIRFNNAYKTYEKNYIYIPEPYKFPNALKQIHRIVDNPVIVNDRPDFLTTGDIIVILGEEVSEVFIDLE